MTQWYAANDGYWHSRGRTPVSYSPDPTGPVTPTYPALPNLPTVNYTDLYVSGDTMQQAISRMTAPRVVVLPAGFDEDLFDFTQGGGVYGLYNANLKGFIGEGRSQARIRLAPQSSTKQGLVPAQGGGGTNPLFMIRPGGGSTVTDQTLVTGLTIEGTDQPVSANNEGRPHNYHGIVAYWGHNAVFQDVLIKGIPGNWNSPPGETFQLSGYKDVNTVYRNVEVDGYNAAGERVGGSPLGGNNSSGALLEDCYLHDSYVSGLTFSFSGVPTDSSAISKDITTNRCKMWHNANTLLQAGKRFTGINHENVGGYVRHNYPNIKMDNMTEWDASHMSINNHLIDNQNIIITEPEWNGISPPHNNGMFTVGISNNYAGSANMQVTPPTVIKNGVTLIPVHIYGNGANRTEDPATHFVVSHNG